MTSGLAEKPKKKQVNTLVYSMGDKAEDILISFNLSDTDAEKYDIVKEKFKGHFVKRRNVIYERARFNQRAQAEEESVDDFITDLYRLAEHCGFGTLQNNSKDFVPTPDRA